MIRRIFILLFLIIVLSSCQKDMSLYSPADISKYDFFEDASVEAPEQGVVAVVTNNETGDTLLISRVATTYEKGIFDDVTVRYVPNVRSRADVEYLLKPEVMTVWDSKFYLMFEDTENGDDDYNDIVVKAEISKEGSLNSFLTVNSLIIHPIALGSSDGTIIDFGVVLPNGEVMKIENVRKELFNSETGFINTEYENNKIKGYEPDTLIKKNEYKGTINKIDGLRFFIEVNGKRLYAAYGGVSGADDKNIYVTKSGKPCGIALSTCDYIPREKVSIFKLYPLFQDWLIGEKNKDNPFKVTPENRNDLGVKI